MSAPQPKVENLIAAPAIFTAPLTAVNAVFIDEIIGSIFANIDKAGPKATKRPAKIPIVVLTPLLRFFHQSRTFFTLGINLSRKATIIFSSAGNSRAEKLMDRELVAIFKESRASPNEPAISASSVETMPSSLASSFHFSISLAEATSTGQVQSQSSHQRRH